MTDPGGGQDRWPWWAEASRTAEEPAHVSMAAPGPDERRRRRLRWALVTGGAAAVVGVGAFAAVATLASRSAPGTPDAAASAASQQTPPSHLSPALPLPAGLGGGPLGAGDDGLAGLPTVKSIGPSSITVTGPAGRTRTFTTDASTTYERDGATVARSALAVGQHVSVRPAMPAGGRWGLPPSSAAPSSGSTSSTLPSSGAPKLAAGVIDIVDPSITGTVRSVHDGTIVVVDGQGFWRTVRTSTATTYSLGGRSSSIGAVTVGEHVVAAGRIDADHTDLDATVVRVVLPTVAGRVTSVKGATLVLAAFGGQSVTVHTDPSTVYRDSSGTATASAVKVGDVVQVQGTQSGGSWLADSVTIGGARPFGPGSFGGRGGFGPGPGGFGGRGFGSGLPGGAGWGSGSGSGGASTSGTGA